jgi:TetR/AcrR family transcriptional repressor of lmrAB and yxaGH operons
MSQRFDPSRKAMAGAHRSGRTTRERLIRAAVFLFQSQGYHGVGLTAILTRARAPKGSLYHHFPGGKEDLAVAAVDWLGAEVDQFLEARLAAGLGGSDLMLAFARHGATDLAGRGMIRGSLIAVLTQDAIAESAAIRAALSRVLGGWRNRIATAFAREMPAEQANAAALVAFALLSGATSIARLSGQAEDLISILTIGLEPSRVGARPPPRSRVR